MMIVVGARAMPLYVVKIGAWKLLMLTGFNLNVLGGATVTWEGTAGKLDPCWIQCLSTT